MASILASLTTSDIRGGAEESDSDGRVLMHYLDGEGQPCNVLVLGRLVAVIDLDDGLRVVSFILPTDCP
jgi:hypothetical protein